MRSKIAGIVCAGICLLMIAVLPGVFRRHRAEEQFADLASRTVAEDPVADRGVTGTDPAAPVADEEEGEADAIPVPKKQIDFRYLQEVNEDIYAWIYLPDTEIDYPVLQHPEDDSYYLLHNMDGSRGYPGCIYTELYNAKDFGDFNTVLYGHNMKDGSMFAGLHRFEEKDFFEAHPYIYIYTEEELLIYEIFAAYEFGNIHLLAGVDTASEQGRTEYLEQLYCVSGVETVRPNRMPESAQEHILTLSTCIRNEPEKRYLVQGVLQKKLRLWQK